MVKKKAIRITDPPKGGKVLPPIRAGDGDGFFGKKPSWKLSRRDKEPPFALGAISPEDAHEVADRLHAFETMTWGEVIGKPFEKKKTHLIPLEGAKLSTDALERIKELKLDQLERLVSLRISAPKRVWGFIEPTGVCNLVWWDPDHKFYPVDE